MDLSSAKAVRSGGEGDIIWFNITRDGSADTFSGDAFGVTIQGKYRGWCLGEFVSN